MVTPLEIYGAIGVTVGLLNIAQLGIRVLEDTYKEYKDFGQSISKVQSDFAVLRFSIKVWTEHKGFHREMSDQMYKALWGKEGWLLIQQQLAATEVELADFTIMVHEKIPHPIPYEQIPEDVRKRAEELLKKDAWRPRDFNTTVFKPHDSTKLSSSDALKETPRESGIWMLRVVHRHIAKSTRRDKKLKYILSGSRQLERKLESLKQSFNMLKELVDNARLPQEIASQPRDLTFHEREIMALTQIYRPILEEAKLNRLDMKILYECCFASSQSPQLELHIITREGEAFGGKIFPILIPQSECGIIAEILGDRAFGNEIVNLPTSFDDACKKSHEDGESHLYVSANDFETSGNGRNGKRTTWFKLRNAYQPMQLRGFRMCSLNTKLKGLTKAERLDLAYTVVESALLLLGTSWLSGLSNTTLKRFEQSTEQQGKIVKYFCDLNGPKDSFSDRLECYTKNVHVYIFTVGAVLVEIALGLVITKVVDSYYGLEMRIAELSGPCSLRKVVDKVQACLGEEYSEAVKFCLQDPKSAPNRHWQGGVLYDPTYSEEEVSVELLDLFYSEAFIK